MFHDLPCGALAQLARFVGGLPRAFGWSAASSAVPDAPAELGWTAPALDRTWTAPALDRTWAAPDPE